MTVVTVGLPPQKPGQLAREIARRERLFLAEAAEMIGPREVGKWYQTGYGEPYLVTAITIDPGKSYWSITVATEFELGLGRRRTHRTGWDYQRDSVCELVPTSLTKRYTAADMCWTHKVVHAEPCAEQNAAWGWLPWSDLRSGVVNELISH